MKMECSDSIDLSKFVLSLMVVAIHVPPILGGGYELLIPILRISVPLFFMISGYLLFRKLNDFEFEEKSRKVYSYLNRILQLYFAWGAILLPITLMRGEYFRKGILMGVKDIVTNFVFGSTFPASWYLMALILGTFIVYSFSKLTRNSFVNDMLTISIGILLYGICCLCSNYGNAFPVFRALEEVYPTRLFNSFPVSIIWIGIGKVFAENTEFRKGVSHIRKAGIIISVVLLYIEQYIILNFRWNYQNDCYFMLVPCCVFIFSFILSGRIELKDGKKFRNTSTIIYCVHLSIAIILTKLIAIYNIDESTLVLIVKYIFVVACCLGISVIVLKGEKCKKLRFLKSFY